MTLIQGVQGAGYYVQLDWAKRGLQLTVRSCEGSRPQMAVVTLDRRSITRLVRYCLLGRE